MDDNGKLSQVTIRQIAGLLGISRGTVDRAIHNRKGVSPETRRRVLKAAEDVGYSPNRIAQFLVTGKTIDVAFLTFSDPLWHGVQSGAEAFVEGLGSRVVRIHWHEIGAHTPEDEGFSLQQLQTQEIPILRQLIESDIDGIAMIPYSQTGLNHLIDQAAENGKAVVTIGADAPTSKRLCFVGQDVVMEGRLAGELVGKLLNGHGRVVAFTGYLGGSVHRLRLEAFEGVLRDRYSGIMVDSAFEHHDSEAETYRLLSSYLANNPPPDGIYNASVNGAIGVVRALEEVGLAGTVRFVCSHFVSSTVDLLKRDLVHASIGLDPFRLGYQAMKILYDYLVDNRMPESDKIYSKSDVGFRENIDSLVGRIRE